MRCPSGRVGSFAAFRRLHPVLEHRHLPRRVVIDVSPSVVVCWRRVHLVHTDASRVDSPRPQLSSFDFLCGIKRIGVALAATSLEFRLTESLCAVWPSCCAREGCISPATTSRRFTRARSHYRENWGGCHNSGRSVVCTLSFHVPCVFLFVSQLMTSIHYVSKARDSSETRPPNNRIIFC